MEGMEEQDEALRQELAHIKNTKQISKPMSKFLIVIL